MNKLKIDEQILIDAIIGGVYIPMGGYSEELTPFNGNQYNENWVWNRDELMKLNFYTLYRLYFELRNKTYNDNSDELIDIFKLIITTDVKNMIL